MHITINGEAQEISSPKLLIELVRDLGLNPETVVAEHNGRIVPRPEYDTLALTAGDSLELIRFVGGG